MEFSLKKGMLLGVSTAATQIEGGVLDTNWHDFYRSGGIKDNTDPATGNDHWIYWQEDTELLSQMGMQIYRFGIEWARIVPEPGKIDEEAVSRYRQELLALKERNIRPMMTIHHFTNPMWFENKGGWTKRENLKDYLDLVELAVDRVGDLVSDYITINEPNVYATNSYFFGTWPPMEKSFSKTLAVMENMAYCHIRAYKIIHEKRSAMGFTDTMVGAANHLRVFAPQNEKNLWHRVCAALTEKLFQSILLEAMINGKFKFPLKNFGHLPKGEYSDFHGLNYYSRSTVSNIGDGVRENCPKNDLDWEIYPKGIEECAAMLYSKLPRPIWVTENGTCDNNDRFRSRYLYEHLKVVSESALPFERYYHWCFCDNFEWAEGNWAKFGLVSVDAQTRKRTVKKSGEFYSQIICRGGVDQDLYDTYVANVEYDVR
jgi:beta-glucosidase